MLALGWTWVTQTQAGRWRGCHTLLDRQAEKPDRCKQNRTSPSSECLYRTVGQQNAKAREVLMALSKLRWRQRAHC